jgi:hypothetical protein
MPILHVGQMPGQPAANLDHRLGRHSGEVLLEGCCAPGVSNGQIRLPHRRVVGGRQHPGLGEVVTHREHQVVEQRPAHAADRLLDLPLVVHLVRLAYRVTRSVAHLHTLSWSLYAHSMQLMAQVSSFRVRRGNKRADALETYGQSLDHLNERGPRC